MIELLSMFTEYMLCVPFIDLWQLSLEYGIKFMETSAKANINVENVSSLILSS